MSATLSISVCPESATTGGHWSVDDLDDQESAGYGAAAAAIYQSKLATGESGANTAINAQKTTVARTFSSGNSWMNKSAIHPQLE